MAVSFGQTVRVIVVFPLRSCACHEGKITGTLGTFCMVILSMQELLFIFFSLTHLTYSERNLSLNPYLETKKSRINVTDSNFNKLVTQKCDLQTKVTIWQQHARSSSLGSNANIILHDHERNGFHQTQVVLTSSNFCRPLGPGFDKA